MRHELCEGPAHAPGDKEIAVTIARGVVFLKEAQSPAGHWDEPAQSHHRLGMTVLAGLALMENGAARGAPEISRPREIVAELATTSDQTYDIALAILFLAGCQQRRRGDADVLIRTLGQRLAGGDREGIWDYQVPRVEPEAETATGRSRGARGRRAPRRRQFFPGQGDNSNTQFARLGLWAASRHGYDSDQGARGDRWPLPVVSAP